jgi:D-glycero-D-manno-heptose 1,7-bisphosphate phosphatase
VAVSATRDAPAVFLDKDGTLIEDLPYNVDPRRVRFAPGAREAVRLLARAGYRLVVCTNQSGVARGYFSEADLDALGEHLRSELARLGAPLAGFYFCPHLPDGVNEYALDCDCRKPAPGLVARAAKELAIDPGRSWFVGDTWMDVVAVRRAGCRTIVVGPEHRDAASWQAERRPEHAVRDLLGAARIIVASRDRSGDDRNDDDRPSRAIAGATA